MTDAEREDRRPWAAIACLLDEADHKVQADLSAARHAPEPAIPPPPPRTLVHRARHGVATRGEEQIASRPATRWTIPTGAAHRMHNTGDENAGFHRSAARRLFGEDDIVRLEDDYGRDR
jgi:mannose-6-phosphate isomerase